jgi:hypothetical protein
MTAVLIFAFSTADFFTEGSKLLTLSWGIVSLVDLYVGFILFSIWIFYREEKLGVALIWVFFMLTLGFFTGSLYMFKTALSSQKDWKKFWLGKHAISE